MTLAFLAAAWPPRPALKLVSTLTSSGSGDGRLFEFNCFAKRKKKGRGTLKKKKKNNASDPDGTDSLGEPQCESKKKTEKKGKATSRNVMRSIQCND